MATIESVSLVNAPDAWKLWTSRDKIRRLNVNDAPHIFWWCNGGHYIDVRYTACPWSGKRVNLILHDRLTRLRAWKPKYTYRDLHGLSECDLLQLLLVPHDLVNAVALPCGKTASRMLADLVVERNRTILQLFPHGVLHKMLANSPAQREYWYARRLGAQNAWVLVDEGALQQRSLAAFALREARTFLENALGVKWSEIQSGQAHATDSEAAAQFTLKRWRVDQDLPPLLFDEELFQSGEQRELFRAQNYPLLPSGHLILPSREFLGDDGVGTKS